MFIRKGLGKILNANVCLTVVFLSILVIRIGNSAGEEDQSIRPVEKERTFEIRRMESPKASGTVELKRGQKVPSPQPVRVEMKEEQETHRLQPVPVRTEISPRIIHGTTLSDEQLKELLNDFDAFDVVIRRKAIREVLTSAQYLTHSQNEQASPRVLRLFEKESDETIRKNAANTLGKLRYSPAVPALIDALQREYSWAVRGAAAKALGLIADLSATNALLDAATEDDEIQVRIYALEALGRLRNSSVVYPLLDELRIVRDSRLQIAVIDALGNIGDDRAAPDLERLLEESPDYGVKEAAARALRRLQGRWRK